MIDRPILFTGEMVRAILDGRKTQTRRVMKTTPYRSAEEMIAHRELCPYGVPGDRLWVRETFAYATKGARVLGNGEIYEEEAIEYRADGGDYSWKPSIHMPRWASRITLEIEDVRVQRVQEISEEDAIAEGVCAIEIYGEKEQNAAVTSEAPRISHKDSFSALWNSINAPRGFGWGTNPWVWAITFRRMR